MLPGRDADLLYSVQRQVAPEREALGPVLQGQNHRLAEATRNDALVKAEEHGVAGHRVRHAARPSGEQQYVVARRLRALDVGGHGHIDHHAAGQEQGGIDAIAVEVAETTMRARPRAGGISTRNSAPSSSANRDARGDGRRPTSSNLRQRGASQRAAAAAMLPGMPTTATVSRPRSMFVSTQAVSRLCKAAYTVRLLPVVTRNGPRLGEVLALPSHDAGHRAESDDASAPLRRSIDRLLHVLDRLPGIFEDAPRIHRNLVQPPLGPRPGGRHQLGQLIDQPASGAAPSASSR